MDLTEYKHIYSPVGGIMFVGVAPLLLVLVLCWWLIVHTYIYHHRDYKLFWLTRRSIQYKSIQVLSIYRGQVYCIIEINSYSIAVIFVVQFIQSQGDFLPESMLLCI